MKLCVVLNASAGTVIGGGVEKTKGDIERGFDAGGNHVEVLTPKGDELVRTLQEATARGYDAIVVGGGDGTIATAADICAKAGVPLGVLPLGTMNMLAKDLKIPLDLGKAIEALAQGDIRNIDIGEVNGETFLCNSTIGIVPLVGQEREKQRGRSPPRMVAAMATSILRAAWQWKGWVLSLEYEGRKRRIVTRLLTVANNAYEQDGKGFLTRSTLDRGELTLYLSRHRSRLGLLWFSLGLLLHFWHKDRRLETITTREVTLRRRRHRHITVSNDGEIKRLELPLVYRVRPGALKVLTPSVPRVEETAERNRMPAA